MIQGAARLPGQAAPEGFQQIEVLKVVAAADVVELIGQPTLPDLPPGRRCCGRARARPAPDGPGRAAAGAGGWESSQGRASSPSSAKPSSRAARRAGAGGSGQLRRSSTRAPRRSSRSQRRRCCWLSQLTRLAHRRWQPPGPSGLLAPGAGPAESGHRYCRRQQRRWPGRGCPAVDRLAGS